MNKNENAWGNFRAWIGPFTVACLDTKPLSGSEAQVDLVLIQTLLLLICKSFNCYANQFLISIVSRSTQTSLSYRGLVKYHRTVKWSIDRDKNSFLILPSLSLFKSPARPLAPTTQHATTSTKSIHHSSLRAVLRCSE